MADLNEKDASTTTKIVGASSAGAESTYINATANGDMSVADLLNVGASQTTLSVSTTAVEGKVGGSNLANRKRILIQCQTANMTYGFSSGSQPFTLPNGTTMILELGPNISIWFRKTSGTGNVVIAEFA